MSTLVLVTLVYAPGPDPELPRAVLKIPQIIHT